ncbi:NAD(P)/FAD-dependent oxidoreductase [Schumannella luteola]|uniref:NAD(P)H-nitrite reductase large subunit n=1 Tax=Schumannella luteola TaxID=472059 RepID=A0A852YHH1_9MICO|nr:NAD(P)/FAD-dependent oxidoreductase [Schumannella luteola]NYH00765.1 NAD(P)H-nitrite reductase large subunit [Schumannella luteola]TPW92824.1 FAD-dependent oxidoreductase [Schumannella luteola]
MADTRFDYLIVGGGMVADAAARGIRELDDAGTIGILSADVDPPYTRPALSKKLWTDPDFEWDQVPLNTVDETGATLRLNTQVTALDRAGKTVTADDGAVVGYGRLLLATGSVPHELDAPDDERIIHFRSAEDCLRLRGELSPGARVVVVGGGYIGAELAAALVQNRARVTLVHPDEVLGGSTFPPAVATTYEKLFADGGVSLRGGRRVEQVTLDGDALAVHLDDGSALGADLVVAGLGVAPATALAEESGLEVDDGVVVDARLRTADASVWAAGDIARYPDAILGRTRVEHVDHATESGRAAGRAMAGADETYTHTPFLYSQVFGVRWEAVGALDAGLDTVEDWIEPDEQAVVYYLDDVGTPVGVLLWAIEDRTDAARALLADPPASRDELIGAIRP